MRRENNTVHFFGGNNTFVKQRIDSFDDRSDTCNLHETRARVNHKILPHLGLHLQSFNNTCFRHKIFYFSTLRVKNIYYFWFVSNIN